MDNQKKINILFVFILIIFSVILYNKFIKNNKVEGLDESVQNLASILNTDNPMALNDLTIAKKLTVNESSIFNGSMTANGPTILNGQTNINGNLTLDPTKAFNLLPKGVIIAWRPEAEWSATLQAPPGWVICDGKTTGVPNLQGKFILGAGPSTWGDKKVRGVNWEGGTEYHTLTWNQMPSHDHSVKHGRDRVLNALDDEKNSPWVWANGTGQDRNSGNAGKNEPHDNMPPFYTLVYIMKL